VEEKVFGREHPEVATTLMSLAALYRARGNGGQAIETYGQALAVLERSLGAQDPLAIETREQLSELSGAVETRREFQILTVRTREDAEALRRRVEEGENFAELAVRHSIDANASNGGCFRARRTELREELRAALDRLGIGQLSPAFPLDGNWAIVRKIAAPKPARE
jgi:parvulin-like peptidyl-prolyl isomerase